MKLKAKPRRSDKVLQEIGLYAYILGHLESDGVFKQSERDMAGIVHADDSQIHRIVTRLITRGALVVEKSSRRGERTYNTPKILRPAGSLSVCFSECFSEARFGDLREAETNVSQVTEKTVPKPISPTGYLKHPKTCFGEAAIQHVRKTVDKVGVGKQGVEEQDPASMQAGVWVKHEYQRQCRCCTNPCPSEDLEFCGGSVCMEEKQ